MYLIFQCFVSHVQLLLPKIIEIRGGILLLYANIYLGLINFGPLCI